MPLELWHRLTGWRSTGGKPVDIGPLRMPDTGPCKAAQALCDSASPPFMLAHCARTYWFARLLGLREGLDFDDEVLFVAGMLHDIALMDGRTQRGPGICCFTIPSAADARQIGADSGWDARRQDLVAEAITLNPNPSVSLHLGVEAHLLNAGVLVDATGFRRWELTADTVDELLRRHPRQQLKRDIGRFVDREADAWPGCRFHLARRWMGFLTMVRRSAWSE